ncbi:tRNA pseudouridine(55) synthase TruB [Hydrococcus rivularis NIES-593]|uniref:tRNA pseudouridine synthase B n=1 Tax=Hydrococcus rivularis NIES-593 TaxID=1921803 RepID=A0A1U7HIN3_9CYAN|nr:tRNA pseudouridine(55) synthase TruB [Hydrococcus rivularis]OKH23450.1 tRNA pseudouridine(55) synthase TruB [Hydrococcus rivularis NIES-593]
MLGFINLNKPARLTSHDCVAKIRRFLKQKKVGHGGTLDPAATGVLPIAVGKATRLLSFLPEKKAYQARIRLGMRTNTDDLEGEVIETQPASYITLDQIQPLLSQFIGKIEQMPPAFSAIQREGKRLYELARKGENVEVPVRTVEVDKIEVLGWYPGVFPELEVAIACGAGTYIRAIARDLGTALNVGGTLAALIRTESCGMKLSDSLTLEQIEMQLQEGTFSLIPPAIALRHLSEIILSTSDAQRWCQGQKISIDNWQLAIGNSVRVNDEGGQCLGIGELIIIESDRLLIPKIVIGNSEKT